MGCLHSRPSPNVSLQSYPSSCKIETVESIPSNSNQSPKQIKDPDTSSAPTEPRYVPQGRRTKPPRPIVAPKPPRTVDPEEENARRVADLIKSGRLRYNKNHTIILNTTYCAKTEN